MAFISRSARSPRLKGFSLVELSIVVAILSVVVTLGLEAAANFVNKTATTTTRERLIVVDDAVDKFFKQYGRLPCPADRTAATNVSTYGKENCSLATTITTPGIGGGLIYGGLPFYALSLPKIYDTDGFGSRINYVVTTNLTKSGGSPTLTNRFASSGGTSATNGTAGIEVRTGKLEGASCSSACQVVADPAAATPSGAAYFIFSSGSDQRGAYSTNGTALKSCLIYAAEKRVDTQNCVFNSNTVRTGMSVTNIPYNVFYDNRLNAGLNFISYFDDVAIWRTKAQL